MKKNVFQKAISVIACVAVICCTGPAWAGTFESCTYSRSSAGSAYSSSGTNMGTTSSYSGMGTTSSYSGMGSVRSGGSFNPVSAFNSGMTGARTAVQASASVTPGTAVTTGQKAVGPVGGLTNFLATHNISSTGITTKATPGTDIQTATDVAATSVTNTVDAASTTPGPGAQQNPVTNVPTVVQRFASMSVDQQMEVLEYGNGSIWHYQETCHDIGADGKPLWQSAKTVFADIVQAMSSTGQIKDAEGNIIANSPFGNNGAGYFTDYEITPGPKANGSWDVVLAAKNEWYAKHNIPLSCGLQESQWDLFIHDMKNAGYIDAVSTADKSRMASNPLNTRDNMKAFLNGQPIDTSKAAGHWQRFETGTFFNASPAGNNAWDGFIDNRSFVCQSMLVNMDATSGDWANAAAEFELLYGNLSCYSPAQMAELKQDFYERKGLIIPLKFWL